MAQNKTSDYSTVQKEGVEDTPHAPFVVFDTVPTFGLNDGVISLTLAAVRYLPKGTDIRFSPVVTAHLRCSRRAAAVLRDTLDKALLMSEPVANPPN